MERQSFQIWLSLALIWLFINSAHGDLSISLEPPGPVKPGTNVKIICNVSKNYQDSPVTWLRRTGSVEFQIAHRQSLESTLYKNERYLLDVGGTNTGVIHFLEIKPVKFEDIGEYGCTLDQSTQNPPEYTSLMVCSNPNSDWCKCIKGKKWADPSCAQEASNAAATNKRLKEGLGACLAIAIIYGLIMTILAGIDCSSRLHERRLRAQKKAAAQEARRRNPYGESEELTLDISDPEQSMNTSQEVKAPDGRIATEPMRYPDLTKMNNGEPQIPVKADVHDGNYGDRNEDRHDAYNPPSYQYNDRANAMLANNYNNMDQYNPNDQYEGINHRMEPLNTVSQGYDRGQLPRSHDYNTPGKMSTHSADYNPQYGNQHHQERLDYPNSRGAYSEQKPRQYGRQGHPANVEPRRLDFAHTKAAEAREPSGPYISPDTCV